LSGDINLRVLLTGAGGFIGSQVLTSLINSGHEVVACTRSGVLTGAGTGSSADAGSVVGADSLASARLEVGAAAVRSIACDFAQDADPTIWLPRLEGVDAVVNCAGILRERGADRFEQVHVETPMALFRACVTARVRRVIQVSALGRPEDTEFIATKHRADAMLAELDLDWVVLRPSIVYSPDGSYGGTSLLRAMAALPGVIFVPGNGQQLIAPLSGPDLSALIVQLLASGSDSRRTFEVVGPETMSLATYLKTWRRWLGFRRARVVQVPTSIVAIASWLGERFGSGPLGMTMYRMLISGSTAEPAADAAVSNSMGWRPRSLRAVLSERPSFVQDRWHARLYFLAPVLRIALGLVWVASAVVGFVTPQQQIHIILGAAGVVSGAVALDYFASAVDLVLGVFLLFGWKVPLMGVLMLICLLTYTVFIGIALPSMWLEPFGGLLKNLGLMPAVLVMMAIANRK
jgi:uncharacterized protein YbjT (DUF2867 family)